MYVNSFLGKEHTFEFGFIAEDEHSDSTETVHPFSIFGTAANPVVPNQDQTMHAFLLRSIFSPGAPDRSLNTADGLTAGIYLQDTFRPHPNVNIKAGLRYEVGHVTGPRKGTERRGCSELTARSTTRYSWRSPNSSRGPIRSPSCTS